MQLAALWNCQHISARHIIVPVSRKAPEKGGQLSNANVADVRNVCNGVHLAARFHHCAKNKCGHVTPPGHFGYQGSLKVRAAMTLHMCMAADIQYIYI